MTQSKKKQRAKVYIWPTLSDEDKGEVEAQCIAAGYTDKRKVKIGRVVCWEVV